MYSTNIVAITKKYIIDVLHSMCFSESLMEDDSQFYDLNVLKITHLDDDYVLDQRSALFINKYNSQCFRLLISCIRNNEHIKSVCYRLTTQKEEFFLEEKKIKLFNQISLDYSIADISFGEKDDSTLSFSDNIGYLGNQKERLFQILKFIVSSKFISCDTPEIFKDLINDSLSLPPTASDIHFDSIFAM